MVDAKTYSVISIRDGGMGRVWILKQTFDEPFDPTYRRRIAVKTFDHMENEQSIENELNIWISLNHQSILPLKKIGRLNYRLAAIMPLLINGDLDDLLEVRGALKEREVLGVILNVVEGLEYAWKTFRILHLDLKPSNILVENTSPLQTKISDWGISRLAYKRIQANSRKAGHVSNVIYEQKTAYDAGTPLFMAPERFSGSWILSPAADIYSIGMIAVQLSTGILPFRFGKVNPIEEVVSGSYFDNASQLLKDRNEHFRRFCLQCIHTNPVERPNTFHDVIDQLKNILRRIKE